MKYEIDEQTMDELLFELVAVCPTEKYVDGECYHVNEHRAMFRKERCLKCWRGFFKSLEVKE